MPRRWLERLIPVDTASEAQSRESSKTFRASQKPANPEVNFRNADLWPFWNILAQEYEFWNKLHECGEIDLIRISRLENSKTPCVTKTKVFPSEGFNDSSESLFWETDDFVFMDEEMSDDENSYVRNPNDLSVAEEVFSWTKDLKRRQVPNHENEHLSNPTQTLGNKKASNAIKTDFRVNLEITARN